MLSDKTLEEQAIRDNSDIIWHYTSKDVFIQFVEGKTGLYATQYKFLNDSLEYEYGKLILHNLFQFINKSIEDEIDKEPDKRTGLENLKNRWNSFDPIVNDKWCNDIYIMSFCQKPDMLYHWRSYTPEGGFCIGFSRKEMVESFCAEMPLEKIDEYELFRIKQTECSPEEYYNIIISNCIYKEEGIKSCIGALLGNNEEHLIKKWQILFALSKHPSFAIENEIRFACFGQSLRKSLKIVGGKPRIPISGFEKGKVGNLIKAIFVSPHGDKEKNKYLAELLAEKHGFQWKVFHSELPYIGG